jgi:predicted transcriptional regulator of viral defense system
MTQIEALTKLRGLGQALFETRDVAALLSVKEYNATQIAKRVTRDGLVIKLSRGKWGLEGSVDPFSVAEHLTAPFPAYISLQTALYHHGMISQIPSVIYVVSLSRTRRQRTPLGVYSIHHIEPTFFFGYELDGTGRTKIAVPEKALVDFLYLRPARSRLFVHLPEIEFPKSFNWKMAAGMAGSIRGAPRRAMVKESLNSLRLCGRVGPG